MASLPNLLSAVQVGSFYEIDQSSLPPKSPTQLKDVRVVMVTEKTPLGVTVTFPSVLSLREYFFDAAASSAGTTTTTTGKRKLGHILTAPRPELDEQFVMSAAHASRILRRCVPFEERQAQQHLMAFWMVDAAASSIVIFRSAITTTGQNHNSTVDNGEDQEDDGTMGIRGLCLRDDGEEDICNDDVAQTPSPITRSAAVEEKGSGTRPPKTKVSECRSLQDVLRQSSIVAGWGVRRKVRYIDRHKLESSECRTGGGVLLRFSSKGESTERSSPEEGENAVEMSREYQLVSPDGDAVDAGEGRENDAEYGQERLRSRRRKVVVSKSTSSAAVYKSKSNKSKSSGGRSGGYLKTPKDRWSVERYAAAEQKLLDIMRLKGAVLGRPMLRPQLREEARKYIGDTGLLDHLLKHMAGKVVGVDGKERFRRRHNPEGAMEYWLEDADLAEARRRAGVLDPCWVPPQGWKEGDPVMMVAHGGVMHHQLPWGSCVDVREMKAEIDNLKSEVEQLQLLQRKRDDQQHPALTQGEGDMVVDIGECNRGEEEEKVDGETATALVAVNACTTAVVTVSAADNEQEQQLEEEEQETAANQEEELAAWKAEVQSQFAEIVQSLEQTKEEVRNQVQDVQTRLGEVVQSLEQTKEELRNQIHEVQTRFEEEVQSLEQTKEELRNQARDVQIRFGEVAQSMELQTKLVQEEMREVTTRFSDVVQSLDQTKEELRQVREELRVLKEQRQVVIPQQCTREEEKLLHANNNGTSTAETADNKTPFNHSRSVITTTPRSDPTANRVSIDSTSSSCGIRKPDGAAAETNPTTTDTTAAADKDKCARKPAFTVAARRSGFRICKPQGTFLWPGKGGSVVGIDGGSSATTRGGALLGNSASSVGGEDLFGSAAGGVPPTPPSASSSTSPPPLPILTQQQGCRQVVVVGEAGITGCSSTSGSTSGRSNSSSRTITDKAVAQYVQQQQYSVQAVRMSGPAPAPAPSASAVSYRGTSWTMVVGGGGCGPVSSSSSSNTLWNLHGTAAAAVSPPAGASPAASSSSAAVETISTDLALASPTYQYLRR